MLYPSVQQVCLAPATDVHCDVEVQFDWSRLYHFAVKARPEVEYPVLNNVHHEPWRT